MNLNHVAITMPPDELDDDARVELLDFYGEVFGWTEGDNSDEKGNPLILYTGQFGQFVYLLPGEPHLSAPAMDHFGVLVDEMSELDEILAKAKARAESDDRVTIIDKASRETHSGENDWTLTSCYIGFGLPLLIELQHLDRRPHVD